MSEAVRWIYAALIDTFDPLESGLSNLQLDLYTTDGEIRQAAKELVDQLEIRMESGLDEIPRELITKADRIAHKVKLGFGTM